ncbi:MAG: hypothetical protein Q8920_09210 [Bacillota bacterium]|nr:hypothetical protein [Bacillota bacterium]
MKITRIVTAVILALSFTTISVYAVPDSKSVPKSGDNAKIEKKQFREKDFKQFSEEFAKDPIKALQGRKEKVQSMLKDGKISREKADEITARIDSKIRYINEFNKLTVPQKKDLLLKDFKTHIEKKVNEGKLDKEQANTIIKDFSDKVAKWDGNGYPNFGTRIFKGEGKH